MKPFATSIALAEKHNCDLAIPNGSGVGDVICYTAVVEAMARKIGRPIDILTAPLNPECGIQEKSDEFSIWKNNPFVKCIINIQDIGGKHAIDPINQEKHDGSQFGHFIENICYQYGLSIKKLKPHIYLDKEEMQYAQEKLQNIKRPIVALHPSGRSSSTPEHDWHFTNWVNLIEKNKEVEFFQVGKTDFDRKNLQITRFETNLREMFALIWASDIFIGFDSSPAHIATAFDKKCVVLWDLNRALNLRNIQPGYYLNPVPLRWGYPQNYNLTIQNDEGTVLELINKYIERHAFD